MQYTKRFSCEWSTRARTRRWFNVMSSCQILNVADITGLAQESLIGPAMLVITPVSRSKIHTDDRPWLKKWWISKSSFLAQLGHHYCAKQGAQVCANLKNGHSQESRSRHYKRPLPSSCSLRTGVARVKSQKRHASCMSSKSFRNHLKPPKTR